MYETDGAFGRSRVYKPLHDRAGELCLFSAEAAGWHSCNDLYRISLPQGASLWLVLLTTGGTGCLEYANKAHPLPAGSVAVLPPDVACAYYTPAGGLWEFYWVHPDGPLSSAFFAGLDMEAPAVWTMEGERVRRYASLMDSVFNAIGKTPGQSIRLSGLLSDLYHRLREEYRDAAHSGAAAGRVVSDRVIDYLTSHLDRPVRLDDISRRLFTSTPHMIRQFKLETGYTPHAYLTELRLNRPAFLLQYTGMPVQAVARETGFSSASHLGQYFKKRNGMSPAEFRRSKGIT